MLAEPMTTAERPVSDVFFSVLALKAVKPGRLPRCATSHNGHGLPPRATRLRRAVAFRARTFLAAVRPKRAPEYSSTAAMILPPGPLVETLSQGVRIGRETAENRLRRIVV